MQQPIDIIKTPTDPSTTQGLRTELGRSVGVTIAIQLLCLSGTITLAANVRLSFFRNFTYISITCYILPSIFLTKPDFDKINGFTSEKRPTTSRKSTKIKMLGCLLPFEFCNVYNYPKYRRKWNSQNQNSSCVLKSIIDLHVNDVHQCLHMHGMSQFWSFHPKGHLCILSNHNRISFSRA